jgi:hypothetical protein
LCPGAAPARSARHSCHRGASCGLRLRQERKSTLARQLVGRTGLPLAERDWLGVLGSADCPSAIAQMAARPRWILDAAPYYADELVYPAAVPSSFSTTPSRW